MKLMLKRALPALALWLACAKPVQASITINWGSPVDSILRDSYGNTLGAGMHFQLGSFAGSFVPTFENIDLWQSNWRVFDEADYSAVDGYFTGTAEISSSGLSNSPDAVGSSSTFNFLGKDAYLWVFNSQTPELWTTQWTLVRDATWVFPDSSDFPVLPEDCCGSVLPKDWSLSDIGVGDTPVFGRTGSEEGGGTSYAESSSYDLQTYTLVPEISSVPAMMAVVLLAGCHRQRRRRASCDC